MKSRLSLSVSRIAIVVAILAFLSDLCNSATSPTVSILTVKLGASYGFVGTMVAVSSLTRLLLVQPVGILGDRIDKRVFLVSGFLCYIINFLLLVVATNPIHILLGRIIGGFGSAFFYTSAVALIITGGSERKGVAVGLYATLMGIGFSLGPLIGGFVAERISYNTSYILSILVAAIALPLAWLGIRREKEKHVEQADIATRSERVEFIKLIQNRELLLTCIGGFFISESIGADVSFFPIFGKDLLLSEGIIGTILSIRAILSTVVRIPIGKATEFIGTKYFMMIALVLSALGLFLVPQFNMVWLFPIFLGLEGIGYGIFLTTANIHIGEITVEGSKGSAVGLYHTFSGIGGVLNMMILGFIASSFGLENTFRFTAVMCIFGLFLMMVLSSKKI